MKKEQEKQNKELLKQGADLLADIFFEQILNKYINTKKVKQDDRKEK
ncbi:hypothetical protein KKA15_06710 [Patescibacteria group bacterium]|nr:hypothetical protein [Patescibacteria group bacterium]